MSQQITFNKSKRAILAVTHYLKILVLKSDNEQVYDTDITLLSELEELMRTAIKNKEDFQLPFFYQRVFKDALIEFLMEGHSMNLRVEKVQDKYNRIRAKKLKKERLLQRRLDREIGGITSFFASLLLSPLIGFILVLLSDKNSTIEFRKNQKRFAEMESKNAQANPLTVSERLDELVHLRNDGKITPEEFQEARKKLLNEI